MLKAFVLPFDDYSALYAPIESDIPRSSWSMWQAVVFENNVLNFIYSELTHGVKIN